VKRLAVVLATTGLVATSLGVGALAQPAFAEGDLIVTIEPAGTKKVDVSWADGSTLADGPFDAYLVTLDNDLNATAADADRSRFVDDAADRSVRFEDLNANTTYYAKVYAVDYQADAVAVVPAIGQDPETALGSTTGAYSPLTISLSRATVVSGGTVVVSGTLTDNTGAPISGATVQVTDDEYPAGSLPLPRNVVTNDNGVWSFTSDPLTINTQFWAEYRPASGVGGWTGRLTVEVRTKISVQVTPGLTVNAGTNVKFSGNVNGNPEFLDDASVKVCLQRLEGGTWRKLFCSAIEPNGDYLLTLKSPGAKADGKYRVFSGMGPAYADSWSPTKKLVVK
jgi:hypothetical protein